MIRNGAVMGHGAVMDHGGGGVFLKVFRYSCHAALPRTAGAWLLGAHIRWFSLFLVHHRLHPTLRSEGTRSSALRALASWGHNPVVLSLVPRFTTATTGDLRVECVEETATVFVAPLNCLQVAALQVAFPPMMNVCMPWWGLGKTRTESALRSYTCQGLHSNHHRLARSSSLGFDFVQRRSGF